VRLVLCPREHRARPDMSGELHQEGELSDYKDVAGKASHPRAVTGAGAEMGGVFPGIDH